MGQAIGGGRTWVTDTGNWYGGISAMPRRLAYLLAVLVLVGSGSALLFAQAPQTSPAGQSTPPNFMATDASKPQASPAQQLLGPPPVSSRSPPGLGSESITPNPSGTASTEQGLLPAPEQRSTPLSASWSDGLRFRSKDDAFHIHVGGSAQIDSTWMLAPNSAFALANGTTSGVGNSSAVFLRRVRLRVDGDIYDQFDFIVEYDFANAADENSGLQPPSFGNISGEPAPINVWLQVRDVPFFGSVRFGNLAKPIGMSRNTSQTSLPFMERADNADAFYGAFDGGFALGLVARNHTDNDRVTWQYGIYRPAINIFGVALNKFEWGGRVTGLPVYEDDGKMLVHLGLGTLDGELPENQLRVRARPLLRNGPGYANPILVDTGTITASRQYTIAPEFAAVAGSWTFQAEWTGQVVTDATPAGGTNQGTILYQGGYAEVLYFLTGEYQLYDKGNGAFGRVIPNQNLRMKKGEGVSGCGAWQVGVRFSYLDLNDKAIQGGMVYDWTAGVNWFWNPNMKVQFNYIAEHRDQPGVTPVWINGVGVRGAYDF
jgi:phosphate-selective porin OprO/OprP